MRVSGRGWCCAWTVVEAKMRRRSAARSPCTLVRVLRYLSRESTTLVAHYMSHIHDARETTWRASDARRSTVTRDATCARAAAGDRPRRSRNTSPPRICGPSTAIFDNGLRSSAHATAPAKPQAAEGSKNDPKAQATPAVCLFRLRRSRSLLPRSHPTWHHALHPAGSGSYHPC